MPAMLVRMILSISLIITTVLVFIFVLILTTFASSKLSVRFSRDSALVLASLATILFFGAGWIGIWAGAVKWTSTRIVRTGYATAGSLLIAGLGGITAAYTFRPGQVVEEMGFLLGAITWGAAFLVCTAIAWRESAAERAERLRHMGIKTVACPKCGYNLTGLRETRCPECGAQFTVDQLVSEILEQRAPDELTDTRVS